MGRRSLLSEDERKVKRKAQKTAWKKANPEKVRAQASAWKARNQERVKEYRSRWNKNNKDYYIKWRKENPDKIKAYNSSQPYEYHKRHTYEWRKSHREEYLSYQKKWKSENKDKVKAGNAAWRNENKEKIRSSGSKYRKNNPDKVRAKLHNKRARKKQNGGKLSPGILLKLFSLQKGKCAICKKKIKTFGSHIDHIIPSARGGKNEDKNVQLTCPECNIKKGAIDPIRFMQSLGYLL